MITGEIRSQIDSIWDNFWSGGIANPIDVIEQMTYLLFIRRLDDVQIAKEKAANLLKKPIEKPIFGPSENEQRARWSKFKNLEPKAMYEAVSQIAFPFIKSLGAQGSAYAEHMRDAIFKIPTPGLLARVVELIDKVPMEDRDTKGMPTYAYELEDAVKDGFFVPPRAVSVPLQFQRGGINYDDLSDEEKDRWDATEWDEDGTIPQRVEPEAVNKWLFNEDTVDKMLAHLMANGQKVAGGDRLGKTIIFAKNKDHARFIEKRFNFHYPHFRGTFARVIDHYEPYAQSILDKFSILDQEPHIAISVDMLDTGIDVPEVLNLVFFKLVRSKTKFFQMLGRGTRLCKNVFGPGQDKEFFYVFDFCQNLEFFNQSPAGVEGQAQKSLNALLFLNRLEIHKTTGPVVPTDGDDPLAQMRKEIADTLHKEVAAMNVNNFLVRRRRRDVEKYSAREAWDMLKDEEYSYVGDQLAGLPSELPPEDETAKRFDLLVLRLQLAMLTHDISFSRLQRQVREIASALEEKNDIPMVAAQMALILDVQTDEWWTNVTLPMLDQVRKRLRDLVKFIDKIARKIIYTDFTDTIGTAEEVGVAAIQSAVDISEYKKKVTHFLRDHQSQGLLAKVRGNDRLMPADLVALEELLYSTSGVGTKANFERAFGPQENLGFFIRRLVGLDREAAKKAFGDFLNDKIYSARQIRFINQIIEDLTANGAMEPAKLFEAPYTDANPSGLGGIFGDAEADRILHILADIDANAQPERLSA